MSISYPFQTVSVKTSIGHAMTYVLSDYISQVKKHEVVYGFNETGKHVIDESVKHNLSVSKMREERIKEIQNFLNVNKFESDSKKRNISRLFTALLKGGMIEKEKDTFYVNMKKLRSVFLNLKPEERIVSFMDNESQKEFEEYLRSETSMEKIPISEKISNNRTVNPIFSTISAALKVNDREKYLVCGNNVKGPWLYPTIMLSKIMHHDNKIFVYSHSLITNIQGERIGLHKSNMLVNDLLKKIEEDKQDIYPGFKSDLIRLVLFDNIRFGNVTKKIDLSNIKFLRKILSKAYNLNKFYKTKIDVNLNYENEVPLNFSEKLKYIGTELRDISNNPNGKNYRFKKIMGEIAPLCPKLISVINE